MKEAEQINGGPIPPITLLMRDADTPPGRWRSSSSRR